MDPLERAVGDLLGGAHYRKTWEFKASGRSKVHQMSVTDRAFPPVIVKAFNEEQSNGFNVGADVNAEDPSPYSRFCSELTGCQTLQLLGAGAAVLGYERTLGAIILEDLGTPRTLSDVLRDGSAAAATDGIEAYVSALAQLHQRSRTVRDFWCGERRKNGGSASFALNHPFWEGGEFLRLCEWASVPVPSGIGEDLLRLNAALSCPGDYAAFSPTDCCPNNCFLLGGSEVKFFDCEGSTVRHALLDLAYVLAPFPTCSYSAKLPSWLSTRLVSTYRAIFDPGGDFESQLTYCLAAWLVERARRGWRFGSPDSLWGLSTYRQRLLAHLEAFLDRADAPILLPALTASAENLQQDLKRRWAGMQPMPVFPAF